MQARVSRWCGPGRTFSSPHASSSSAKTAALQVALKALHYYGGAIDGIKGPETIRGTKRFQHAHHLTADGIAGSQTRKALGVRGRPSLGSRSVRVGERGWDVAAIQFLLRKHGSSPGTIDGGFGPNTDAAVRRFQGAHGLTVDGIVGSATLGALQHGSSGGGGSFRCSATRSIGCSASNGSRPVSIRNSSTPNE